MKAINHQETEIVICDFGATTVTGWYRNLLFGQYKQDGQLKSRRRWLIYISVSIFSKLRQKLGLDNQTIGIDRIMYM